MVARRTFSTTRTASNANTSKAKAGKAASKAASKASGKASSKATGIKASNSTPARRCHSKGAAVYRSGKRGRSTTQTLDEEGGVNKHHGGVRSFGARTRVAAQTREVSGTIRHLRARARACARVMP